MSTVVLAAARPLLDALREGATTWQHDFDLLAVPSLSASTLAHATPPVRAVFVANPATTWSLRRIEREVRSRSAHAVVAVAYLPPGIDTDRYPAVAERWLTSTPTAFVDDPMGWPTRCVTQAFTPTPDAPSGVRRFVSATLASWRRDALAAPAVLAASELTTNALLHARRGPVEVTVADAGAADDHVHLVVADTATDRLPVLRTPTATSRGGRGLRIVAAIAAQWGVTVTPNAKRIWCELPATPTDGVWAEPGEGSTAETAAGLPRLAPEPSSPDASPPGGAQSHANEESRS